MSNYSLILNQFKQKFGCSEDQRYSDYELNRMLDKLAQANAGINEFDRDVSQQLYENSKVEGNKILLRDFINTLLRAEQILYRNISDTQKKIQFSSNLQQNQQNRENIKQFTNDLQLIAGTFNLPPPPKSKQLDRFSASPQKKSIHQSHNASAIFAQAPSQREQSTSLKIVFWLLLISLLFEFILIFVRHHFLNCLAYIFVFGIYLLNYFDRSYIRTCLVILLVSVILDFVWAIVEPGPYWNNDPSHRSSLRPGFLKFIYMMTIILMVSKSVIMIILFRFRSNTEETRKYVRIFNLKFDLDGRPVYSPVYNILNGTQIQGDSRYTS